jgi:hypothetical protein
VTEPSETVFLVTSIPPKIVRHDKWGHEIGGEYQQACVASWLHAGFTPVSINSIAEPRPSLEGVRYVTVRRDARRITGKPLIYFDDLLAEASRLTDGPVVITNADIVLKPPFDLRRLVSDLRAGEALFSQRSDVSDLSECSGSTYANGFDFFAICGRDLAALPRSNLIFGWPWWDYFLPMSLILNGIKLRSVPQVAFHLLHQERHPDEAWFSMGQHYLQTQRGLLRRTDGKIGLAIKAQMDEAARRARKNKRLLRLLLKLLRDPRSIKYKKRVLANTSAEILGIVRTLRAEASFPPTYTISSFAGYRRNHGPSFRPPLQPLQQKTCHEAGENDR